MSLKYLHAGSMPPRLNIPGAIAVYLFLEHWNAPGWCYGAMAVLYAFWAAFNVAHACLGTAVKLEQLAEKVPR